MTYSPLFFKEWQWWRQGNISCVFLSALNNICVTAIEPGRPLIGFGLEVRFAAESGGVQTGKGCHVGFISLLHAICGGLVVSRLVFHRQQWHWGNNESGFQFMSLWRTLETLLPFLVNCLQHTEIVVAVAWGEICLCMDSFCRLKCVPNIHVDIQLMMMIPYWLWWLMGFISLFLFVFFFFIVKFKLEL